jgi:hypothetical protein
MGGRPYIALSADHLVAVVLGGKGLERGLNDTTTKTEDQVEGRFLSKTTLVNISPSRPIPMASFFSFPPSSLPSSSRLQAYLLDVVV